MSKRSRKFVDALPVLGATALFTYLGFLLIAGIAHTGESDGGGRIVAGVLLLLPWFLVESAINRLPGIHDTSAVSYLTTGIAVLGQFLYYFAIYWLLRRLWSFLRR